MKKPNLNDLKRKLDDLYNLNNAPEVIKAQDEVRAARKPQIEALIKEMEALRATRPKKKPRWPENIPQSVLDICEAYWKGTTEYWSYRIHMWNDKVVWTSYPSGGYSDNGGFHPCPACFYLLSFKDKEFSKPKRLHELTGRISNTQMARIMAEKSREMK